MLSVRYRIPFRINVSLVTFSSPRPIFERGKENICLLTGSIFVSNVSLRTHTSTIRKTFSCGVRIPYGVFSPFSERLIAVKSFSWRLSMGGKKTFFSRRFIDRSRKCPPVMECRNEDSPRTRPRTDFEVKRPRPRI